MPLYPTKPWVQQVPKMYLLIERVGGGIPDQPLFGFPIFQGKDDRAGGMYDSIPSLP